MIRKEAAGRKCFLLILAIACHGSVGELAIKLGHNRTRPATGTDASAYADGTLIPGLLLDGDFAFKPTCIK
jgi:hypothetical protein